MTLSWAELNKRIVDSAIAQRVPVSGAFELTARCNLRCKMCYLSRFPGDKQAMASELPAEDWIRIGREARDAGLLFLILTGGEVFLRSDFRTIYEALSEMGLNITIYTNASLVTPEKAKWLGSIPPSKVSVTVYGASPETYERVTGFKDAFDRTLRGLEYLRSEDIRVEIKTTVIEGNYLEFDQISELAKKYGIGLGIVNYISPRREGSGSDPVGNRLSPSTLAEYEKKISEYNLKIYMEQMKETVKLNHDTMTDLPLKAEEKNTADSFPFRCQSGRSGFWITWDGRMTPCGLLDIPMSKPLETGFQAAWELLKEGCGRIPKCPDCNTCSSKDECLTCPARLMTETGSFERPAQYLCDLTKNRKLLEKVSFGR